MLSSAAIVELAWWTIGKREVKFGLGNINAHKL